MTARLYGKIIRIWKATDEKGREHAQQYEIMYKDVDAETGETKGIGTEDFSPERRAKEIEERWVYTWDGKKLNRGGHKRFDEKGFLKFRKADQKAVKQYIGTKNPEAVLIQLRK